MYTHLNSKPISEPHYKATALTNHHLTNNELPNLPGIPLWYNFSLSEPAGQTSFLLPINNQDIIPGKAPLL